MWVLYFPQCPFCLDTNVYIIFMLQIVCVMMSCYIYMNLAINLPLFMLEMSFIYLFNQNYGSVHSYFFVEFNLPWKGVAN